MSELCIFDGIEFTETEMNKLLTLISSKHYLYLNTLLKLQSSPCVSVHDMVLSTHSNTVIPVLHTERLDKQARDRYFRQRAERTSKSCLYSVLSEIIQSASDIIH